MGGRGGMMRFLREARSFVPALRFSRARGRSRERVKIGLALGGGLREASRMQAFSTSFGVAEFRFIALLESARARL